jgi:hypothetical protein
MKCPNCSNEMVSGRAHIGGGVATLFLGGEAMETLQLAAATNQDERSLNEWRTTTSPQNPANVAAGKRPDRSG